MLLLLLSKLFFALVVTYRHFVVAGYVAAGAAGAAVTSVTELEFYRPPLCWGANHMQMERDKTATPSFRCREMILDFLILISDGLYSLS